MYINSLPPGTLLGLVPGVIYEKYQDMHIEAPVDSHFFRFDGTIFHFDEKVFFPVRPHQSREEMEKIMGEVHNIVKWQIFNVRNAEKGGFERVSGSDINPYAVGHMINHTPLDGITNVSLVDIFIPNKYPIS
jgi:hypothetical protein